MIGYVRFFCVWVPVFGPPTAAEVGDETCFFWSMNGMLPRYIRDSIIVRTGSKEPILSALQQRLTWYLEHDVGHGARALIKIDDITPAKKRDIDMWIKIHHWIPELKRA